MSLKDVACPHCGKPAGQNDLRPAGEMICRHCGNEWLTEECAKKYTEASDRYFDAKLRERAMNPLQPTTSLLGKLGSILVHAEEMASGHRHWVDKLALETVVNPEVTEWLQAMRKMALIPVKRN